ncbi:glycine zipper 2TM domain-containing protein [Paraburkholderia sp. IMGN_8]|uniref:glycine zipper 2TM domain-containing protein n=1 Tax=Paraburkholderia sp. IMGN_8 TaxID=3136564 RepID=UPI003100C29E
MYNAYFAKPTFCIALCAALSLSGCVAPGGSMPYGSNPAQPTYEQPTYAQPTYVQPTYPQPVDSGNSYRNSPPASSAYGLQYGVISTIQPLASANALSPGSVMGTVVGAVVGGVVGNQFGGGRGRDVATVVGALGGAVAGNQIGQQYSSSTPSAYRIVVQVNDGSSRSFDVANPGDLRPGDRVRIDGNRLDRY